MRRFPDGVVHCPACDSKVLPIRAQGTPMVGYTNIEEQIDADVGER